MRNNIENNSSDIAYKNTYNAGLAVYSSLFYCLPIIVWVISQTVHTQDNFYLIEYWPVKTWAEITHDGMRLLLSIQALIFAIIIPWFSWREKWQHHIISLVILILTPSPLLSVVWLSGGSDVMPIFYGLLSISILAIALLTTVRLLENLPLSTNMKISVRVSIQTISASLLWMFNTTLLTGVGL